eukprot:gene3826-4358_t
MDMDSLYSCVCCFWIRAKAATKRTSCTLDRHVDNYSSVRSFDDQRRTQGIPVHVRPPNAVLHRIPVLPIPVQSLLTCLLNRTHYLQRKKFVTNAKFTISKNLPSLVNRLRLACSSNTEVFVLIRQNIHLLNRTIYEALKQIKDRKFNTLATSNQKETATELSATPVNIVETIPADLPLSEEERKLLNKGLKFVPIKKNIDEFQSKHDCESFFRRLRLKAHFEAEHDRENVERSGPINDPQADAIANLFPTNSHWTPQPGKVAVLDLYIEKCRYEIAQINFKTKQAHSNLTTQEWMSLKQLKARDDIVIKPADKGGRIVVWRKDPYLQEGNTQLQSPSYRALEKNPTKSFNKTIINTIKEEIDNNNLPSNANKLYIQHPRTSVFYMLPKIHKANNPGRPIVSAVSCPTSHVAAYLDSLDSLAYYCSRSPDIY